MTLTELRDRLRAVVAEARAIGVYTGLGGVWRRLDALTAYPLDLSEKNLRAIRLHVWAFNGEHMTRTVFEIAGRDGERFAEETAYRFFTEDVPERFWISEPEIPGFGPIGCNYLGRFLNYDLTRYQQYISNLYRAGLFEAARPTILEIGAGYGAIPYHALNCTGLNACCVVVDLPHMLIYTGAYVMANLPGARAYVYRPGDEPLPKDAAERYDLILMPNYRLQNLSNLQALDCAINTLSMQEMSVSDIESYLDFILPRLRGFVFADYHRPSQVDNLTNVDLSTILGRRFELYPGDAIFAAHTSDPTRPIRHTVFSAVSPGVMSRLRAAKFRFEMMNATRLIVSDTTQTNHRNPEVTG